MFGNVWRFSNRTYWVKTTLRRAERTAQGFFLPEICRAEHTHQSPHPACQSEESYSLLSESWDANGRKGFLGVAHK
ncbi:MAG: hypothetical protein KID04_03215 [Clostridium sp.]|jgi:hypothetical protein|nr:hypothetical protein [Clostridium sp.]